MLSVDIYLSVFYLSVKMYFNLILLFLFLTVISLFLNSFFNLSKFVLANMELAYRYNIRSLDLSYYLLTISSTMNPKISIQNVIFQTPLFPLDNEVCEFNL